MLKPPTPTLSVLADLRPADDSVAALRDAISRASVKRAEVHTHRGHLAASVPQLTLETEDDAQLDQVEADVRSADRDIARIDALIVELRTRLVPAQHEETAQRLAVQARLAGDESDACRTWMAETVPAIAQQILEGARIRLSAKIAHQSYNSALLASGLPAELAATLPAVAPPLSAMGLDRITLSTEQTIAATLLSVSPDASETTA